MFKVGYVLQTSIYNDSRTQEDALQAYNCDEIIIEPYSDKFKFLKSLISSATPDFAFVVQKLSALGNNASCVYRTIQMIREKGATIISLDGMLDTRTPESIRLLNQITGFNLDLMQRMGHYSQKTEKKNERKERPPLQKKTLEKLPTIISLCKSGYSNAFIRSYTGTSLNCVQKITKKYKDNPDKFFAEIELYLE